MDVREAPAGPVPHPTAEGKAVTAFLRTGSIDLVLYVRVMMKIDIFGVDYAFKMHNVQK